MKHYRIEGNLSEYQKMIVDSLKNNSSVKYLYIPLNSEYPDRESLVYKIPGFHEFFIDEQTFQNPFITLDELKKYEVAEVNMEYYKKLNEAYIEYNRFKNDVNSEKERIFVEYKSNLEEQKKEVFEDTVKSAEKEIEKKAQERFENILKSFQVSPDFDKMYDIFKDKISAEAELKFLYWFEQLYRVFSETIGEYYISAVDRTGLMHDLYYIYEEIINKIKSNSDDIRLHRYINTLKNSIVDHIMKVFGYYDKNSRGRDDYWIKMQKAGKLADLIEQTLWEFYNCAKNDNYSIDIEKIKNEIKDIAYEENTKEIPGHLLESK